MTVGELLRRMDSREISEWMAYFHLEHQKLRRAEMEQKAERGLTKAKNLLKKG